MYTTLNTDHEFRYSITHWFQPIYCLKNNKVLGFEALLRDASHLQVSPVDLFKNAERYGHRNTLDFISMQSALETFKNESNLLFLNVFPSTLLRKDFLSWWDIHVPSSNPIVLELLENEPIMDWEEITAVTKELKARGIKIAVDDMGGGYSFFQQWIELEPDFIKLDRYFANGLSTNLRKQKTVKSLIDLLSDTTEIIMEGIETEEDLNMAVNFGIPYAQGYLLGRPSPVEKAVLIHQGAQKCR